MATSNNQGVISAVAGADHSSNQFKLVKQHTVAGQVVLCGDGGDAIGVLLDDVDAAGKAVAVATSGVVRAYAGGTIAIAARVASDASGLLVTAATSDIVLGIAKTAGVSGSMMEIYWDKSGIAA